MGPTASGKTQLAFELAACLPCDVISVDSAMVYRGMDIGTAKPTRAELLAVPHQLLDIRDLPERYSAGQFCQDARKAIELSFARQRIPLLVGGTMLYFRALQAGLSPLPEAHPPLRAHLAEEARQKGWPALHHTLSCIDPVAAQSIHPQDSQRIQRALEIYYVTGKNRTEFYKTASPVPYHFINLGVQMERAQLEERIIQRFHRMVQAGLIEEVERLKRREDLVSTLPALRAVGYPQVWDYLDGKSTLAEMKEKSIIATRQLAKRQMTWLRRWPHLSFVPHDFFKVRDILLKQLSRPSSI